MKSRSPTTCPVVFTLDILGDRWSLVILRDVLFNDKRHFREFLASEEKIASNILSARLEAFICAGLLAKEADPTNRSAAIYTPTQKALELLPMFFELIRWGLKYNPNAVLDDPNVRQLFEDPELLRTQVVQKFSIKF